MTSRQTALTLQTAISQLQDLITQNGFLWQSSKLSTFLAPYPDPNYIKTAHVLRARIAALLIDGSELDLTYFGQHPLFYDMVGLSAVGFWNEDLSPVEETVLKEAQATVARGWSDPHAWRMFCVIRLFKQPFNIEFMTEGLEALSLDKILTYIKCMCVSGSGQFMNVLDDLKLYQRYLDFFNWCDLQMKGVTAENMVLLSPGRVKLLQAAVGALQDSSICFAAHCRTPHRPLVELHAHLLKTLDNLARATERKTSLYRPKYPDYVPPNRNDDKLRIGYIMPTIENGPDARAVLYEIEQFPADECEIYLYSEDFHDRNNRHDAKFYRRLFNKVSEVRNLSNRILNECVDILREDQLDILVFNSARHRGFGLLDRLLCYRMAPVQVSPNRIQVFPIGMDTFDYFICGDLAPHVRSRIQADSREDVVELAPVSLYEWPDEVEPKNIIRRKEDLGIGDDEIMYYSSSAVDKLIPQVIDVWVRILARQPNAKLVLSPFNPTFYGLIAMPLLRERIHRSCKKHGVDPARIILLSELQPFDTHQLLDQADVYLVQWPHGGITMLSLALWRGCPFVMKECYYTTGCCDPSMARSAGMGELVVEDDEEAYIGRAVELANDPARRKELRQRMLATRKDMPQNKIGDFSPRVFALLKELHARKTGKDAADKKRNVA